MKLLTVEDVKKYIEDETKKLADRAVQNINEAAAAQVRQLEIQRDSLTLGSEISTLAQAATLFLADDVDTVQCGGRGVNVEAWISVRINGGDHAIPDVWRNVARPRIPAGKYRVLAFFLPLDIKSE